MATISPIDRDRESNGSPVTAASPMIGVPSEPNEHGALLASADTRSAARSATPTPTRMGATTAHG